jgi:hypothetical protein
VIHQSASDDAIPVSHIRVNIQGKPVSRNPICIHLDTDDGNFSGLETVLRPAARAA